MIMKRNTLLCYILAACTGLLAGCQKELTDQGGSSRAVTIKLNSQAMTRANNSEPGINELNENKVTTVDVFFFEDLVATNTYYEENVTVTGNEFQVVLPNELEGQNYYVGIIANCDQLTNVEGKTWSQLLAQTVTTEFQTGDQVENCFVMQGISGPLALTSGGKVGPISLKRVASKISLYPIINPDILINGKEINGVTYTPNLSGASVTLRNMATKASLDGTDYKPVAADLKAATRTYKPGDDMTGANNNYSHLPLYSYPTDWTTEGGTETYLELCIPWSYEQNGTQMSSNYYYHVPIGKTKNLKSNAFYYINAQIDVLGSLDPTETVLVEGDFVIKNWSTLEIDAEMNRYEYLMLETNRIVLNNEASSTIYLASSSTVSAKVVSVTYQDYKNILPETKNEDIGNYHVEINGQSLTFEHDIDPEAFTPRTITIEITNTDDKKEMLTIVQNPAIYAVADNNSARGGYNRFVYGVRHTKDDENSSAVKDDNQKSLGGVYHYNAGSNNNPNQYTIYVTVLNSSDNFVIGDPRKGQVDNLNNLQKVGRGLKYYYPSKEDTETRRVIAPSFKIASSWGVTDNVAYEYAKKRCASYQENGYPAGRWRVPTEGEVDYVIGLSAAGKIPELFDGDYFASSGRYRTHESGIWQSTGESHAVRCVYDVWYWGDGKIATPETFTWGDEPRN